MDWSLSIYELFDALDFSFDEYLWEVRRDGRETWQRIENGPMAEAL
jgi:hypothetical protein